MGFVNPVAETRQPEGILGIFGLFDVAAKISAAGVNFLQHIHYRLVGPPVQGSPQGADAGGNRGVKIDPGATHHSHRRGGAILLMIPVKNEQLVEGRHHLMIDLVRLYRRIKHHIEKVGAIRKIVARVNYRMAYGILVGKGRNSPHLGNQPGRHLVDVFPRIGGHLRIKAAKRVDHGG